MAPAISRLPVTTAVFSTPAGLNRTDLYAAYNATLANIGISFNDSKVLSYELAFKTYFDAVFSDSHDALVTAWSKIVTDFKNGKITQTQFNTYSAQLGAPLTIAVNGTSQVFTMAFAQSINGALSDTATASQYAQLFRNAAATRYQSIISALP
jgi:hypothetical protein